MTPNPNFATAFVVAQSPAAVFRAINNPRGWWSEAIEGATEKQGDEFTYHYQDMHRCRIRLIEVVPDSRVAWHVLDNHFSFTEDETEWKGTTIVFDISRRDGGTELRFTHQGLVPAYECFEVCSNAWGSYINGSLKSLIATGKGRPNSKEES
jgi:hypothetical protein